MSTVESNREWVHRLVNHLLEVQCESTNLIGGIRSGRIVGDDLVDNCREFASMLRLTAMALESLADEDAISHAAPVQTLEERLAEINAKIAKLTAELEAAGVDTAAYLAGLNKG